MYHPRLLGQNSPLSPITPMEQSSFSLNQNSLMQKNVQKPSTSSKKIVHFDAHKRRSFSPPTSSSNLMKSPDLSPILEMGPENFENYATNVQNLSYINNNTLQDLSGISPSTFSSDTTPKYFANEYRFTVDVVLEDIGLNRYAQLFRDEEIDLQVFFTMKDSELQEIGIVNENDRNIILNYIKDFNFC